LKLVFIAVNAKPPAWLQNLAEDYVKKLGYWIPVETQTISNKNFAREARDRKKRVEADALLAALKPNDFVIACDERGRQLTSMEFSKKLETFMNSGKKRMVVVIGGAYGLNDEILERADFRWSLSTLTFNHHLAMAASMEQIYRGMTILKNVSYHNE
jgi:23S rRNA (pseudouridine1915-N3)-methyltransferase